MKIILANVFTNRYLECEVDPNKPFIEIFETFRQELDSATPGDNEQRMHMLRYATLPSIKPSIHTNQYPQTQFDFWKSPIELGVSEGTEIWLGSDTRFDAGILPLNALYYHFDDLKEHFQERHQGFQCALLYTDADRIIVDFMEKHLASEIVELSGNIVVYAPIKDLFENNDPKFRRWWEKEYRDSNLVSSWDKINYFILSLPYKSVRECLLRLRLSETDLPCIIFFDKDYTKYVGLKLSNVTSDFKLLHTLRQVFSIANIINDGSSQDKMGQLLDELESFEKHGKETVSNFPITLFSFSLVDVKGISLIEGLFQFLKK